MISFSVVCRSAAAPFALRKVSSGNSIVVFISHKYGNMGERSRQTDEDVNATPIDLGCSKVDLCLVLAEGGVSSYPSTSSVFSATAKTMAKIAWIVTQAGLGISPERNTMKAIIQNKENQSDSLGLSLVDRKIKDQKINDTPMLSIPQE